MPHHCAAFDCNNNSGKLYCKKNISFHRFPLKDPNRLRQWLLTIKRKNFVPNKHSVLCSDHFSNTDFEYTVVGKARTRRLKKGSVPSKFDYGIKKPKHKGSLDITDISEKSNFKPEVHDEISNTVSNPVVCYVKRDALDCSIQTDMSIDRLLAEIKELKKENAELKKLKKENAELKELKKENAELKKILQFSTSCTRIIINQNFIQKDPNDERSASDVSGRIICYMKRVLEEKSVQTENDIVHEHQEDVQMLQEQNGNSEQMLVQEVQMLQEQNGNSEQMLIQEVQMVQEQNGNSEIMLVQESFEIVNTIEC